MLSPTRCPPGATCTRHLSWPAPPPALRCLSSCLQIRRPHRRRLHAAGPAGCRRQRLRHAHVLHPLRRPVSACCACSSRFLLLAGSCLCGDALLASLAALRMPPSTTATSPHSSHPPTRRLTPPPLPPRSINAFGQNLNDPDELSSQVTKYRWGGWLDAWLDGWAGGRAGCPHVPLLAELRVLLKSTGACAQQTSCPRSPPLLHHPRRRHRTVPPSPAAACTSSIWASRPSWQPMPRSPSGRSLVSCAACCSVESRSSAALTNPSH